MMILDSGLLFWATLYIRIMPFALVFEVHKFNACCRSGFTTWNSRCI